jgi:hypothetical protein
MKLSEQKYGIIYYTEQLKAAQAVLKDTPDYFYRKVCRWYSEKFHTELTKVYELPYSFLLQHYYESQLDSRSYNEVFDFATRNLLKIFVDAEEEANKAFALELEREQAETLKKKLAKSKNKEIPPKIPEIDVKFDDSENEGAEDV